MIDSLIQQQGLGGRGSLDLPNLNHSLTPKPMNILKTLANTSWGALYKYIDVISNFNEFKTRLWLHDQ